MNLSPAPVATLQMYAMTETVPAVENWWRGLRGHLIEHGVDDAPEDLSWPQDLPSAWRDPGLVLSQTCGAPLMETLKDSVRVIGTPAYDSPLTDGILYSSAIIVHRDNRAADLAALRGSRVAINGTASYSGYHVLRSTLAPLADPEAPFFAEVLTSGGHIASLRMVADGEADCAAIDGITFAQMTRHHTKITDAVRILAETTAVPGLPYITRGDASDDYLEALRRGVAAAFTDPALAATRAALLLKDFERTGHADYAPNAATIAAGQSVTL